MDIEMGMVATQDIPIGQYLTPPIPPFSYSPRSSLHCASLLLSSSSSSSFDNDDGGPPSPRLLGLLTNRHKLLSVEDDMRDLILEESASLAADGLLREDVERALCAVVTNGVEVFDDKGQRLGTGVYGPEFSWINHSCSPNACYRFVFPGEDVPHSAMWIAPSGGPPIPTWSSVSERENGAQQGRELQSSCLGSEPRVIVRSIRAIRKGEEVTIAYTDLLQPKSARLSELWSKYRFTCCCRRCSDPLNYVDHSLQEIFDCIFLSLQGDYFLIQDTYGNSFAGHAGCHFNMPDVTRTQRMSDFLDNAIQEYLSESDPRSCCEKLENFLVQGIIDMDPASVAAQTRQDFPLRPLHFLSLSAFTTLASTYRAYSNQLIDLQMQSEVLVLEAFDLSKAGAAYSVLLAGVVQHFSSFESSLMVPLASFWTGAGESLLSVFRNPAWNVRLQKERLLPTYSSPQKLKCCRCSFIRTSQPQCFLSQSICLDLERMSKEFLSCATDLVSHVWGSLSDSSRYLGVIKQPINFQWLWENGDLGRFDLAEGNGPRSLANGSIEEERLFIYLLGVHCLVYGGLLSSLCFGKHEAFCYMVKDMLEDCLASVTKA